MATVCAVVLTFNRKELLKKCLNAIIGQTANCAQLIVVDNASHDGTSEMLQIDYPTVQLCRLSENVGAAGGFNLAMRLGVAVGAEFLWVMDDDVIADEVALQELLDSYNYLTANDQNPPFVISSARAPQGLATNVPDIDRSMNSLRYRSWPQFLDQGIVPVQRATFVSILFPVATFAKYGFPIASMFIWGEDTEFTIRITKKEPGYFCGRSKVTHVRATAGSLDIRYERNPDRLEWYRHEIRNRVYICRRHGSVRSTLDYIWKTARKALRLAARGDFTRAQIIVHGLTRGLMFKPAESRFDSQIQNSGVAFMAPSLAKQLAATMFENITSSEPSSRVVKLNVKGRK